MSIAYPDVWWDRYGKRDKLNKIKEMIDAINNSVKKSGDTMTGTLNAQHILPDADATRNLGNSSLNWANLYIGDGTRKSRFYATTIGSITNHNFHFMRNGTIILYISNVGLLPYLDNTYDLGASSYRWRHGYFADDVEVDRELRVGVDADTSVDRYFHVKESTQNKVCARFTSYNQKGGVIEINTTYTAGDQEADIIFMENGSNKGSFLLETDDRRWEWWEYTGSYWHNQMYLDVNGNLYIDGTYNTFSPYVGDTEDELLIAISEEVEKPYLERGKDGRIICPVCSKPIGTGIEGLKRGDCVSGEHFRNLSKHAKDMGKITLASGKLLLKYGKRIRKLEEENQELKSRLAKIEEKLGLA